MLSFEWRELEGLCDRLSDLRHRYVAAQRIKHAGLVDGLKADIAQLQRQRELLVQHISARLSAVAGRHHHIEPAARHSAARHDPEPRPTTGASAEVSGHEPLL